MIPTRAQYLAAKMDIFNHDRTAMDALAAQYSGEGFVVILDNGWADLVTLTASFTPPMFEIRSYRLAT